MDIVNELEEYKKTVDNAKDKLKEAKSALKKFYNDGHGDLLKELNSRMLTDKLDSDERETREMLVKWEHVLQKTAIIYLELWQRKYAVFQEARILIQQVE
ncbi:2193_t:CDS:2 [Paraglomus occultum]|uniref:2193_t:CDS:1 n=1 Tax=Paraglomus occultum TaxID=144539 RepID=A0A9N8Z053_9GLOM|nr:2193_t:CDS:2 [Paraglomus occultum]